jgi:hypothetical protein
MTTTNPKHLVIGGGGTAGWMAILRCCKLKKLSPQRRFFIDCSGFNGLLTQKTLGEKLISYKNQLFNDSTARFITLTLNLAADFQFLSLIDDVLSISIVN